MSGQATTGEDMRQHGRPWAVRPACAAVSYLLYIHYPRATASLLGAIAPHPLRLPGARSPRCRVLLSALAALPVDKVIHLRSVTLLGRRHRRAR